MGAFEKLLSIVRRPVANVREIGSEKSAPQGKVRDELPASEEELLAALDLSFRERLLATTAIDTAGARREELLMEPGSDEAIALIGREVDAAQLLLDRLDRLEPELAYRLSALRDQQRIGRWRELRDAYCQAGVNHAAALRAIQLDNQAYAGVRNAIMAEFPDSAELLPKFYFVPKDAADRLVAALDRLYLTQFSPRPAPAPGIARTVHDIITTGTREEIEMVQGFLGTSAATATRQKLWVRFRIPVEIDGQWHPAQSVIELSTLEAEIQINAGRATLEPDQQQEEKG